MYRYEYITCTTTSTTTILQPPGIVWDYPGEPVPQRQKQEDRTNLDLLQQELVSGSNNSWAICKSAPRPRQITTPASATVFYRPDALPATKPTASKH